jgi:hypothetical protein
MLQKKIVAGLALGVSVLFSSLPGVAGVIDFENVPQTYWFKAGGQNLGSYYEGVTFGTTATILENQVYGYNYAGFPPHSGNAVLGSVNTSSITAQFDSPQQSVSLWYTSSSNLTFSAYDSSNNLITQSSVIPNLQHSFMFMVDVGNASIDHFVISGVGDSFTIDDFSAPGISGNPVPEPSAVMFMGIGGLTMAGFGYSKRRKVQAVG